MTSDVGMLIRKMMMRDAGCFRGLRGLLGKGLSMKKQ